jgi:hypothetical protein
VFDGAMPAKPAIFRIAGERLNAVR